LSYRKDLLHQMGVPVDKPMQLSHKGPWPIEDVTRVYQEEVSQVAETIGALMNRLNEVGGESLRTIVGGLHGLSLGETTGIGPIPTIFTFLDIPLERTSHVPLLVYGPDSAEVIDVTTPTELIDILPTFAGWAGAVVPQLAQGTNLTDRATTPDAQGRAYTETGDTLQIRRGKYLYMFRNVSHHMSSIDPHLTDSLNKPNGRTITQGLWNLDTDPTQEQNMFLRESTRSTDLRNAILQIRRELATPPPDYADSDRLLKLHLTKAEGYW
ncbi:MAG: hypothetical protein QGG40_14925, partial [Myxococcota bacterium]|nr:hypothetical protein [Myxococcota bacterium]